VIPAAAPRDGHGRTPTVLYAAESLFGARTGVGRAALEVARAVRAEPGLARLHPVMGGRLLPERLFDAPPEPPAASAGPVGRPWRDRVAAIPLAGALAVSTAEALTRRALRGAASAALDGTGGRAVLHEPNMLPRPFDAGPTVAVVNDLSWRRFPELHPADRLAWIGRHLPRALRQVSHWVAISAFTADEMAAECGLERARIAVAPLAAGAAFRPLDAAQAAPVLAAHGLADRGYVLAVGTLEPRKNLERLAAAHALLPAALRRRVPLALAGGLGWGTVEAGPALARAIAAGDARPLGRVDDAALAALYARAAAVAYPSLYEGFGLPVLEAMACGAPLVHSATTAVAETAGHAGLPVDPLDPEAIAGALAAVLEDTALAARLSAAGLARASEFGWADTARRMAAVWREAAL
jgi:glycosyltransferase involved in cell wall biosynthesis